MRYPCVLPLWIAIGFLQINVALAASDSGPANPGPSEARQFDFWLGDWEVRSPEGKLQGTNRIELVAGGLGLLEQWASNPAAGNVTGRSLNAWNPDKKQWQQFWVGSDGAVLEFAGGWENGRMVLRGEHPAGEKRMLERISWTPISNGSVRQLWEQSQDAGKSWQVVFDGRYTKKTSKLAGGSHSRALLYLFW